MMKSCVSMLVCAAMLLAACFCLSSGAGASPSASVSMGAYAASDFKDESYLKKAVQKVMDKWKPSSPLPDAGKKTVVISTIGRDGKLLEARFNLKSGSSAFDDAAMASVKGAAPFAALPKSYTGPSVEIHWHFQVDK